MGQAIQRRIVFLQAGVPQQRSSLKIKASAKPKIQDLTPHGAIPFSRRSRLPGPACTHVVKPITAPPLASQGACTGHDGVGSLPLPAGPTPTEDAARGRQAFIDHGGLVHAQPGLRQVRCVLRPRAKLRIQGVCGQAAPRRLTRAPGWVRLGAAACWHLRYPVASCPGVAGTGWLYRFRTRRRDRGLRFGWRSRLGQDRGLCLFASCT